MDVNISWVGGAQVPVPAGEQLPGPVDLPVRFHLSVFRTGLYCTIKCLMVFLHLEVHCKLISC